MTYESKQVDQTLMEELGTEDEFRNPTRSRKGQRWGIFAQEVLNHIEGYVVPQYGDEGEDFHAESDAARLMEEVGRYYKRFGRSARGLVEQKRDLLKIAHYAQMAHHRLCEEEE